MQGGSNADFVGRGGHKTCRNDNRGKHEGPEGNGETADTPFSGRECEPGHSPDNEGQHYSRGECLPSQPAEVEAHGGRQLYVAGALPAPGGQRDDEIDTKTDGESGQSAPQCWEVLFNDGGRGEEQRADRCQQSDESVR